MLGYDARIDISSKDMLLRTVYSGSDHMRDVQNMIYSF